MHEKIVQILWEKLVFTLEYRQAPSFALRNSAGAKCSYALALEHKGWGASTFS
jgi:hypothetical protein